jgi:transcriptional regulator with XRE-family HTH domain
MNKMNFGDKLVMLRRKHNISQKDLANKIGVHVTNISRYEQNLYVPNHETLIKISKFFNVSLDYLLIDEHENPYIVDLDDLQLLQLVNKIASLPEKDRNRLKNIIKSYLQDHYE